MRWLIMCVLGINLVAELVFTACAIYDWRGLRWAWWGVVLVIWANMCMYKAVAGFVRDVLRESLDVAHVVERQRKWKYLFYKAGK